MHLWTGVATDMTGPAAALSSAVYGSQRLSLREFEAARITIARINDCLVCRNWLSAEFARRFAVDHLTMDDAFFAQIRAAFTDDEIVDLGICVGAWIAQGRLNRVLDVDGACRVPAPGAPVVGG